VIDDATHYLAVAAAYARGALGSPALDDATAIARGSEAGLKLHRFKRSAQLPRVRAVIGALRGFAPDRLVDLGSGRGAFVWPLLDAMTELAIVAVDRLAHRAVLFEHVARGGIARLAGVQADITQLPFAADSVPCVTALEVLEHLPGDGPELAAREALRIAGVAVIASVPSHEDNNPDHVHLFDGKRLTEMFRGAGARRVSIDYVQSHIVAVAAK
jgi:ubiquinone/menaquinone biosynthesis C-methylase UbiE